MGSFATEYWKVNDRFENCPNNSVSTSRIEVKFVCMFMNSWILTSFVMSTVYVSPLFGCEISLNIL